MPEPVAIEEADAFLKGALEGVVPNQAWGETAYFYNPGLVLKRGTYFATIKEKDGANDRASALGRKGVWRLNMGLAKDDYARLFGRPPARPARGMCVEGPWDFTALDVIMPHPVYAWMGWAAVLCPSSATFDLCKQLLAGAHDRARAGFERRIRNL